MLIDDLLVILVLYKVRLAESLAHISLENNFESGGFTLFVYDNSPLPQPCESKGFKIIYVHDRTNAGVSKAYNAGFAKARELGKKWVLLADQDTHFPNNYFNLLEKELTKNQGKTILVPLLYNNADQLISPFKFKRGRGCRVDKPNNGVCYLNELQFINSGMAISVESFEKCGGYDEDFPLDFSDLAFIERLKKITTNFVLVNAKCKHHLSSEHDDFITTSDRFLHYCRGSKLFGQKFHSPNWLFLNRLLRAIKLMLHFRSLTFIKALFHAC